MIRILSVVMVVLFALGVAGLSFAEQGSSPSHGHYKDCGKCCGQQDAPAAKGGEAKTDEQGPAKVYQTKPSDY